MRPIETIIFVGILMVITIVNLKLAIWYSDRKQAKQTNEANAKRLEALQDMQSMEWLENNFDTILEELLNKKRETFTVFLGNGIIMVVQTLETYEKTILANKGKYDA